VDQTKGSWNRTNDWLCLIDVIDIDTYDRHAEKVREERTFTRIERQELK
jgi:hypothetical protein